MRTLSKITIAGLAALLVVGAMQPVEASCGNASLIATRAAAGASFIWTANWTPEYYTGYPPFQYGGVPPVSPNFSAVYWAAGAGDPAPGLGSDNGIYDLVAAGGFYYYEYYGTYYAGEIFSSWFPPGVDGCITGTASNCTCVLLTDQDGMNGYFALVGALADGNANSFLQQDASTDGAGNFGGIVLVPVPAPVVTGSTRVDNGGGSFDVDVQVTVPNPGGVYVKDGCNCGPAGYKVVSQVVARNSPPPSDRVAGWAEAALAGGGAQPVTALNGSVTVHGDCGVADSDTWLATQMVFDSGFTTSVVSANSTRVECGPNLADPDDKPIRPRPGRTDRPRPARR